MEKSTHKKYKQKFFFNFLKTNFYNSQQSFENLIYLHTLKNQKQSQQLFQETKGTLKKGKLQKSHLSRNKILIKEYSYYHVLSKCFYQKTGQTWLAKINIVKLLQSSKRPSNKNFNKMKSKELMDEISSNDDEEKHDHSDEMGAQQKSANELTSFSESFKSLHKSGSERLSWKESFAKVLSVNILKSNFESMSVSLHYGNFCLLCHVLYVKLPSNFIQFLRILGKGSFGSVHEMKIDGNSYAIKVAEMKGRRKREVSKQLYKEYFLACLADQLGVGPKMTRILGYDLLVTQTQVLFSMQNSSTSKMEKNENMLHELSQSLNIMHSVGFIHSDIKPENIAFSETSQKHVFLDFGLSSLRPEKKGEKSLVSFIGTLSYCSQQMKKCYILRQKMLVDLYENDIFSLKKTLQAEQKNKQILIKSAISNNNRSFFNEKLISQFCTIVNLKYEIFEENKKNIIKLLQKCANIPKSSYEVLESKNVNKEILEDERIKNFIKTAKEKLSKSIGNTNETDLKIYLCINDETISTIFQQSFPIKAIIQLEKQKFIEIFDLSYWLMKIFVFLDPFEAEKVKQTGKEEWSDRKRLIKKIFQTFASEEQISLSNNFPDFISLKTEFTLHFLYDRMKSMKNLKVLHSLRLLFLATMSKFEYKLIQQIQQQILLLIKDKDELILRIVSFHLFWRKHNCGFDFEYKQLNEWFERVTKQQILYETDFSKKLRSFLVLIYTCSSVNDRQNEIQELMNEISNENQNEKIIYLIESIANQLHMIIYNEMKPDQQGLEQQILTFYQNRFFQQNFISSRIFRNFLEIYQKFASQLFLNQIKLNIDMQLNWNNFILLYGIIGFDDRLISSFTIIVLNNLFMFFEMVIKEFYQDCSSFRKVFDRLCKLAVCLRLVQLNLKRDDIMIRLTSLHVEQIFQMVTQLLNFFKQKYKNSKKIRLFAWKVKSFQIQMTLNNDQRRVALSKQFAQSLFPYCFEDKLTAMIVIEIFHAFKKQILEVEGFCFKGFYFRDAFQRFCDEIYQQKLSYASQVIISGQDFISIQLQVKLAKNKIEQGFNIFLFYFIQFHKMQNIYLAQLVFEDAYLSFLQNISLDFLYQKYCQLIKDKSLPIDCNYFIMKIVLYLKQKLTKNERVSLMYRFACCLQQIKPKYSLTLKVFIMKDSMVLNLYKNMRQKKYGQGNFNHMLALNQITNIINA